jgi:amidophosphoribosyltransferase
MLRSLVGSVMCIRDRRKHGLRLKFNPLPEIVGDKKLVVVDDSIVRGTTTRQVVAMLREAGAAEVHFRVSSPPYRYPCFYGMDTGRRGELLAADLSVGEIREYLGVDSIAYLDLDRLTRATHAPATSFCTACLSNDYPVPVELTSRDAKLVLEGSLVDLTSQSS